MTEKEQALTIMLRRIERTVKRWADGGLDDRAAMQGVEQYICDYRDWRKRQIFDPSDVLRDLAEKQEPLGAEFERIYDENRLKLLEE